MKKKHIELLIRFHKPTSRNLYTLRDCGVSLYRDLKGETYEYARIVYFSF